MLFRTGSIGRLGWTSPYSRSGGTLVISSDARGLSVGVLTGFSGARLAVFSDEDAGLRGISVGAAAGVCCMLARRLCCRAADAPGVGDSSRPDQRIKACSISDTPRGRINRRASTRLKLCLATLLVCSDMRQSIPGPLAYGQRKVALTALPGAWLVRFRLLCMSDSKLFR